MKTHLSILGCYQMFISYVKKIVLPVFISMFMFSGYISYGQSQQAKKEAEIKKFEAALKTAQNNQAKAERSAVVADSLVEVGTQMVTEGKAELKQSEADRKALDKEYASNKKPLEKQSNSKDKETATQAKTELKALDTKFKADIKALDTKAKEANKKITTGSMNIQKGKTNQKTAGDAVKRAQASVDAAQAKLDTALGNEQEEKGKKGKKK